jgi:hypothetical protein
MDGSALLAYSGGYKDVLYGRDNMKEDGSRLTT